MKKITLLALGLLSFQAESHNNNSIKNIIIGGAVIAAGTYATWKISSAVTTWYLKRYTIPALTAKAETTIKHQQWLITTKEQLYPSLNHTEKEENLIFLAQHPSIFARTLSDEAVALRFKLQQYSSRDLLTAEQKVVLRTLEMTTSQLAIFDQLTAQITQQHAAYFDAYNLKAKLAPTCSLLYEYYGDNPEEIASKITPSGLRKCFGYKSNHAFYLLEIAESLEKIVAKLTQYVAATYNYPVLHAEIVKLLTYLSKLEIVVTDLREYPQHVTAHREHLHHQELLRVEKERLRLEEERIVAERRAARAAEEQAWQMQRQNNLKAERNRIEKERNQREREAARQEEQERRAQTYNW